MSLRPGIPCPERFPKQDVEPPRRRLIPARAAFRTMNAQTRGEIAAGQIDLGREQDFALGKVRIHPCTCEVDVAGRREIVQPRAMQVLVALVRANGAVVSRDQLVELCWEGRVVGDDAINRAIAKVRAAAELSDPPAFKVETIPRIGFRLKVPAISGTNKAALSSGARRAASEQGWEWSARTVVLGRSWRC